MCRMCPGRWIILIATCTCLGPTTSEPKEISDATNEFSVELLKTLMKGNSKNVVVSPVTVYTSLAFLLQAARGNSSQEISKVLRASPSETIVGYHNLTLKSLGSDAYPAIRANGRISRGQILKTLPAFYGRTVDNFLTVFARLFYFSPDLPEQYDDWITSALNSSAMTELVTVDQDYSPFLSFSNKISLNSSWREPFLESNMTFSPAHGQEVQVPAMYQEASCSGGISKKLGAKWVRIKLLVPIPRSPDQFYFTPTHLWNDRDISLLLILPTKQHGLDELVENLRHQQLSRFFSYKKSIRHAKILFPEFRFDTSNNLIPALKEIGLHDVFKNSADLGGLAKYQLKVSRFYDKIHINVDKTGVTTEKGTGNSRLTSGSPATSTGEALEFTADHPFLFFIVDQANLVPIIAGRVADPSVSHR